MASSIATSQATPMPEWVPQTARTYLRHTARGESLRDLARGQGCHASTVLRQVRAVEARRDDDLVDRALDGLKTFHFSRGGRSDAAKKDSAMNAALQGGARIASDESLTREAPRILARLAEAGACLAVARDMEKAVVVRDVPGGESMRTAIIDRDIAEALALKDWIACKAPGRISRYRITPAGRAALRRLTVEDGADPVAEQNRDMETRNVAEGGVRRRVRYNAAESPLTSLSRRSDSDGKPFVTAQMVAAGERLREDFELSQMGPRITQNWDRFLTGGDRGVFGPDPGLARGASAARDRVMAALSDLGPGLGDVALRCCCFLEGLEQTEKRMGWSARSGKIVLRIALQRLCRHYDERSDGWSPLIG